jgi:hypothetical protein
VSEQTSITIPGVTVSAPVLTVNRAVTGSPPAEVITSLVLSQDIRIADEVDNPNTQGFSTFTWTWRPPSGTVTDDVTTALTDADWTSVLPCLDPTRTYTISIT